MIIHPLITDSATLADLCARMAKADFVTVDTEFMRENTYWPELCLFQISDGKEAAAIDPMVDGIDLAPLLHLLTENHNVLKVFHAGSQDIEIIINLAGKMPSPIFDTQIAAMALGQSEQIGYSNLVEQWLGLTPDKGARFTDWSHRPLSDRQIDYAIGDVTHLAKIFPMMLDKLVKTGRGEWLDQEMERLSNPRQYHLDADEVWKRVKIQSRKPVVLGRLKALAAWRERFARTRNLPRGRIVRDETLADLAMNPPKTQGDLAKVRGLSAGWASNDGGRAIMSALNDAAPLPDDEMPDRDPRKQGPGKDGVLVADLLKLLLKIRARDIGVAARLLARNDDLDALASGQREGLAILTGWRYDQIGHDALDLVEGRLGFTVRNGKLAMSRTQEEIA